MTRPHIDRLTGSDFGETGSYSLKVGRKVPQDSVNLAFVSSPKLDIKSNVSLVDLTDEIIENGNLKYDSTDLLMVSDDNFLLSDRFGRSNIENRNIVITDEFSTFKNNQSSVKPLYYRMRLEDQIRIDDERSLANYIQGYSLEPPMPGKNLDYNKMLLYVGSKLTITKSDGSPLGPDDAYKVCVTVSDIDNIDAMNKVFSAYIYTNFRNTQDTTYVVTYQKYSPLNRNMSEQTTSILNAVPIFEERDYAYIQALREAGTDDALQEEVFAVVDAQDTYKVFAPSKMITSTEHSRPPVRFKYRVLANIKAKYSEFNPYALKVGIIYEATQPYGESVVDILCNGLSDEIGLPPYVTLENPHPNGNYYKYDPNYWIVDLNMPDEFFMDYDVLILTGYGQVNLDIYSEKFHTFLNNGGKLLIDNLTNEDSGRFKPIVNGNGRAIMDIGCIPGRDVMSGVLSPGESPYFLSQYYVMNQGHFNTLRHEEEVEGGLKDLVGPEIEFGINDSSLEWKSILKFPNGQPAVVYKKYNDRGTIVFSSCGILRAYRASKTGGAANLIINFMMAFAEDRYITTPWIYDHLYHRDNLFQQEYIHNGKVIYMDDSSSYDANVVVAKKVLAPTTKSAILPYVDTYLYNSPGRFHIIYESQDEIQMTTTNDGSQMLYAYAVNPKPYSYAPLEAGYSQSSIKINNEPIMFKYRVIPFTHTWIVDNNIARLVRINGPATEYESTISRSDGMVDLGPFASHVPALPNGTLWSDTSKIFYELQIGFTDNGIVNTSEHRINIGIYDKKIGKYLYNNNAQSIVSYNHLYSFRQSQLSSVSVVADDLIVQAWTNHYTVSAKARTFSVKPNQESGRIYLKLPEYTDERDPWILSIHNGSFKKTRYTQQDYESYVKLMKYRYGEEYNADMPVFPNKTFEYSTQPQFDMQVFNGPKPLKKIVDERGSFINEFMIGVNNHPLYIQSFDITQERLTQISDTEYKSINKGWLQSKDITIFGESSPGVYVVIDPTLYAVDYKFGIVQFHRVLGTEYVEDGIVKQMPEYLAIYASYSCSNIQIYKRRYANQLVSGEMLKKQSDSYTFIVKNRNIATHPIPRLFRMNDKDRIYYSSEAYTINFRDGVVTFKDSIENEVYIDYTYYIDDVLSAKDYDIQNGYIYLNEHIDFTDEIYVSYFYQEEFVYYKGYYDGFTFHYLDLNPSEGHLLTYNVADGGPRYELVPTSKVINKSIYVYLLPYKEIDNITQQVTYRDHCLRHCFGEEEMALVKFMYPEAIVLGMCQIKESAIVENAFALDTRVRGGGLKTDITSHDIQKTQPLSDHYWDLSTWDGVAYQSNGVIVVRLPKTVLKEHGGRHTRDEVQEIVSKYAAYGTYQIIEYI